MTVARRRPPGAEAPGYENEAGQAGWEPDSSPHSQPVLPASIHSPAVHGRASTATFHTQPNHAKPQLGITPNPEFFAQWTTSFMSTAFAKKPRKSFVARGASAGTR
jgi:hypothetical protein